MKKILATIVSIMLLYNMSVPCFSENEKNIFLEVYVSSEIGNDNGNGSKQEPFSTIEKAKQKVSEVNHLMTGDIIVHILPGMYKTQGLKFGIDDSGKNGFYVRYIGENPKNTIIHGGEKLENWHLYKDNIYRAELGSNLKMRDFFVNGRRAIMARSRGEIPYFNYNTVGHFTSFSEIANWRNPEDIEFSYRNEWTNARVGVKDIKTEDDYAILTMEQPAWQAARTKSDIHNVKTPWYIVNAFELLDEEGEYYYDKKDGYVYYIPRINDDMKNATTYAAVVEKLIILDGKDQNEKVSNLSFSGLGFSYTTWYRPGGELGVPDAQSNIMRDLPDAGKRLVNEYLSQAAFEMTYSDHINISDCRFEHIGGAAINMHIGTQNVEVVGTVITDGAAGGIQMGDPNRNISDNIKPKEDSKKVKNITIKNNYISNFGIEYRSSVGVFGAFVSNVDVIHNEICYFPYSGITIGWDWSAAPTQTMDNTIIYNYIHDGGTQVKDLAGIYTLGSQPRTVINGNYINRISSMEPETNGGAGVYLDQGSSFMTVSNNVIRNISGVSLKCWQDTTSHDVHFFNNTYNNKKLEINSKISGLLLDSTNQYVGDNVFWTPNELAIIANAGLEKEYMNLRPIDKTAPEQAKIEIKSVALTSIYMEWDIVYDDVGVNTYTIYLNDEKVAQTHEARYSLKALKPDTEYRIKIVATDDSGKESETVITKKTQITPFVMFETNFNNMKLNEQAEYYYTREVGSGTVKIQEENNNRYIDVSNPTIPGKASAVWWIDSFQGEVEMEMKLSTDTPDEWMQVFCVFQGGSLNETGRVFGPYIAFQKGILMAYDGTNPDGGIGTITTVEPNKWYAIKICFSTAEKTYDVYLDNELVVEDFPFRGNLTEINGVWSNVADRVGHFKIDDFKVTLK